MTTNGLLVLAALSRGSRHGYALMQLTGIPAGSLYRTLKRLHAAGLVGGAEPESRKRLMFITPQGQRVLTGMLNQVADLLNGRKGSLREVVWGEV